MSAAEALKAARSAGVLLGIDGDALTLEAAAAPPRAVLDQLARHKADVMALLRPAGGGWSALDWLAYFDGRERSAVAHGVVRAEAGVRAFACCVVEWLNRNPAASVPGRCAWCGETESSSAVIIPFGIESEKHAWLHSECWHDWHRARRTDAVAALNSMGIRA